MKMYVLAFSGVCLLSLVLAESSKGGDTRKKGGTIVIPSQPVPPPKNPPLRVPPVKPQQPINTPKIAPINNTPIATPINIVPPFSNDLKADQKKTYAKQLQKNSPNWNTNADQKAALDKLLSEQALSDAERQQLSGLLANSQQAGLSREDETALSALLQDETARNAQPTSTSANTAGPLFVRIYNNTGERLKVYLQVVPEPGEKKDEAKPSKKLDTFSYDLETGKAYDLQQRDGQKIKASVIRVWAESSSRSWALHRDQDLQLTTPANKSKTYTLTFGK